MQLAIGTLLSKKYLIVALLMLTVLAFYKGITPSFSSDDYIHLDIDSKLTHIQDLPKVFSAADGFTKREFRPLVRLSMWANYQMGESALAFKVTNLLLHLISIIILHGLMLRLGTGRVAAFIGAAVFALHPIHTTSVHFILGRTDLVAACFYFATLLAVANWGERPKPLQYVITIFLFSCALLSKEVSVTLPVMMCAILFVIQPINPGAWLLRCIRQLWPFFMLAAAYIAFRILVWLQMLDNISGYTNFSLINIAGNLVQWIFALIYPFDLYAAQERLAVQPHIFLLVCALIILILTAVIAVIWPNRQRLIRNPLLWLGLTWIAVTLLPMAGGNAHRWYLYIPSAGLSLMIAAIWQAAPDAGRNLLAIFTGLFLIACTVETIRQSLIWNEQDKITRRFLEEFEQKGLHKLDQLYFANMPFGYKSAFLFTYESLEKAISLRHGRAPDIHILSYINIDDDPSVSVYSENEKITFSLEPTAYRFFMLSATERRFSAVIQRELYAHKVTIDELSPGGKIKRYSIAPIVSGDLPMYYFDGKSIRLHEAASRHD